MIESTRIHKLIINGFRGVDKFDWNPDPDINVILGGGDTGKSTILDSISMLFSPTNSIVLSESDYWLRDCNREFFIEAIISLPTSVDTSKKDLMYPWEWDGKNAVLIPLDDQISTLPPVYKFRVRGTSDLELIWEIVQPDLSFSHLSVGLRRSIGVVSLTSEERNDRDLRLVYGSALDKLLNDAGLRARIGKAAANIDVQDELGEEGEKKLTTLDKLLKTKALPHDLSLGLTSSKGVSIGSLVGLLADKEGVPIPLTSWGSGTRRMATLEIISSSESNSQIIAIDEVERGLEPYRQRNLIKILQAKSSQVFLTTHSPITVNAADKAKIWYMDFGSSICELEHKKIQKQLLRDPETFFAKYPIIVEGATEVGFLSYLLEIAFKGDPLDYGVRVCNAAGNDEALGLMDAFSNTNITYFGLVDNEGTKLGSWERLKGQLGDKLLQWEDGCTEESVFAVLNDEQLETLLYASDGDYIGDRARTLADRANSADKSIVAIKATKPNLRELIIEAATGNKAKAKDYEAKDWRRHGSKWFKSVEGGRELAERIISIGVWIDLQPKILPLINEILQSAGKEKIVNLLL